MMWCTYCQKDNHDDAQCWSTRPANGPQDARPAHPVTLMRPELVEFANKEIDRQIRLRLVRSPAGLAGLFPGLGTRKR